MLNNPLIVNHDGYYKLVVALSDIDGTINNQELAESDRLDSINPAREAFQLLEEIGISVGLVTGRSMGETLLYQNNLHIHGLSICESGSIIIAHKSINDGSNNSSSYPPSIHSNQFNIKIQQMIHKEQKILVIGDFIKKNN